MPNVERKYTLFYIPRSGLFYDGGAFLDGYQQRIFWDGSIPIYDTHAAAVVAKEKILKRWPQEYSGGQIVVLSIEPRINSQVPDFLAK